MNRPTPAPGHLTASPDNCPECNKVEAWKTEKGLQYFAQLVRHESDELDDLTLADVVEYVVTAHQPDEDMICRECGERWYTSEELPNLGGMRCQAWIDMAFQRNEYIMGRLAEIRERWSM